MLCVSPLAAGLFDQAILESGDCDHDATWGMHSESHTQENMPSVGDLRGMTTAEVFAANRGRPAIDGWIVPRHPLDIINEGGWNPRSVILGGNSYDGLMPWYPESYMPTNRTEWEASMLSAMTRQGFSAAGKQAVLAQYCPERYPVDKSTGEPFYRAALAQLDGDLAVTCPTKVRKTPSLARSWANFSLL
jgi:carboxylesterase type B